MLRIFAMMAALFIAAAGPARAEMWVGIGSSTGASLAVDRDSIGAAAGSPHAFGAWIRAVYPISIDCSPPRACYAASQRIYVSILCPVRAIAVIQRISMDLNGNIVAQHEAAPGAAPYFRPAYPGVERDVVHAFCGAYDDETWWSR